MGEPDHDHGSWREWPAGRRTVTVLPAGVVGLAVLGVLFVVVPGAVVDHDLAGSAVAPNDRLKAVNDVRTILLQVAGGSVVLFGAYATWRQLRVSQDGLRATQEGYVTDRFSRAVDQLGSGLMGWSTTAMAARYQHMVDAVRADIARQVDGLIWKREAGRPDEDDDGTAGAHVPAS